MIDKYIDGEVELGDFISQMETKMKEKKIGRNRIMASKMHGNKRLGTMFNINENIQDQQHDSSNTNKTVIVSINDFL